MWKVLLALGVVLLLGVAEAADKDEESYVKVEIKGTLQTGVFAIGGETTGTLIKTKDGTFELDLGKNKELRTLAEKLNGKPALVTGRLTVRAGVEVRQRLIVTVETLDQPPVKGK
jgi:hypothetical protein